MADQAIDLVFDSAAAQAFLDGIKKRHDDIINNRSAFVDNVIGIFVFQDIMSHFEKEQGPTGPWKQWSASWAKWSADHGYSQILQKSGKLRQSFIPGNWRSKPDGIEWFNPARTKTGFPYAYAHDTGGPKLPKRSFMWLSQTAMDKISAATAAFLAGD